MKVLIGINTFPGHIYCRDEFVTNLKAMVAHAKDNGIDCHVLVVWNGQEKPKGFEGYEIITYAPLPEDRGIDILYKKQNMIRSELLEGKYDFLYMLESDTLPPEDTITEHIKADKDAVSCMYFIQSQNNARVTIPDNPYYRALGFGDEDMMKKAVLVETKVQPSVWGIFGNKSRLWDLEDCFPQRGLVRAYSSGVGACLFKTACFENVEFKIREADQIQQFTDFLLFKDLHDRGFELFVDTDRIAQHLHYDFSDDVSTKWFNVDTLEGTTPALPPYKPELMKLMSAEWFDYKFKELKDLPAERTLNEICTLLEKNDLQYWLAAGTILGIHRDNKLIEWDTDLDIEMKGDVDPLKLAKLLESNGYLIARTASFRGRLMQIAVKKNDVLIDFHFFWDNGHSSYMNYNECGSFKFPQFMFDNLTKIELNGREYSAPADVEAYLDIHYKEWRKVIKGRHWKTYTNFDERA